MRTFLLIAILEGVFVVRLVKTKKFMPAGLMLILWRTRTNFPYLEFESHLIIALNIVSEQFIEQ